MLVNSEYRNIYIDLKHSSLLEDHFSWKSLRTYIFIAFFFFYFSNKYIRDIYTYLFCLFYWRTVFIWRHKIYISGVLDHLAVFSISQLIFNL